MTTAESIPPPTPIQFRAQPARIPDVPGIHRLIQHWADATGDVLPRTEGEIYETLRDFFVVRDGSNILAAGALHIEWKSLAEIKSLVVSPTAQGQGLGRLVVNACLAEALTLDIRTVFVLTTSPQFFERLGFQQAAVSAFPRKVWNECFRCPKYAHCDEVALSLDLQTTDLTALDIPVRE